MKKVLSLVLAIAIAASLGVVAFAAAPALTDASLIAIDSNVASASDTLITAAKDVADLSAIAVTPGDVIYVALGNPSADDVKGYKLFTTNVMGGDLVEAPVMVYAKVPGATTYEYYAKIVVKSSFATSAKDVSLELKVGKTTSSASEPVAVEFAIANKTAAAGDFTVEKDYAAPVVAFDDAGEEDIEFAEVATYTVDCAGQDDLFLGWNTKFNSTVAAKYADANLDFVNFLATPVFNRMGELYIYADEGTFLYEVVAGDLKATKATYDEDYGAFVLKTRKLGSYAVSDKEIKLTVAAPTAPATPDKSNVNTGAYDTLADLQAVHAGAEEVVFTDTTKLMTANSDGALIPAVLPVAQGKTLYYELDYCLERADMAKVKVKADWKVGGNLFTGASIVYKKIAATGVYTYAVALTTVKVDATKDLEYVGDITLYKTSISNPYQEVSINFGDLYLGAAAEFANPITTDAKLVKFTAKGDETIEFQGVGEFEIDLADQGTLYLDYNTDANMDIINQYPDANLEFVTFVGAPAFNKTGLFYMYADEGTFLYEVVDGKLVAKNATYDDDYGALKFAAKKLGSYVISDKELVLAATETKPVVNTGAAVSAISMVVMAAAAAVVLNKK